VELRRRRHERAQGKCVRDRVWVAAIAGELDDVLPVCAWCTGQYGISEVYVGVPARLGRRGVEEIVELDLNDDELAALRTAAEAIRAKCADLR
jgi:malate dehydrogenase